ncbi:MAG: hypothetical protein IKP06_07775 [Elusimicrobiaceae bacterium]|nr:hypothetical protein [Elusimicrobiaceae bacterium]
MAHGFTDDKEKVEITELLETTINEMQRQIDNLQNNYWKTIYPIGAIYMSTSQTNPASLFGGTWVAWGSGRVPVGVNAADSDFNTVEKTGGEKKHTLTIAEMPRHAGHVTYNGNYTILSQYGTQYSSRPYRKEASNEIVPNEEYTGSGQPHNIVQPYITCYMWKRTA